MVSLAELPGPSLTAAAAGASFVGVTHFDGWLATTVWPRREIAALLPHELCLAGGEADGAEPYPVIVVFGQQKRGTVVYWGTTMPLAIDYHEFCLAVPFVRHREGRYLHVFFPRMCSSYFPAVSDGNVHYGLAKRLARMAWRPPIFWMTDERERLLFHAAVEPTGPWAPSALTEPDGFRVMRAVFGLPLVGQRAGGRFVTSYFEWDMAPAEVRPCRIGIDVDSGLVDGLAARQSGALDTLGYEVRAMTWRLSWPQACRF